MTGAAAPNFPAVTIAVERTIRLVASARLRDPVLRRLVRDARAADLAEIESATSGRLTQAVYGSDRMDAREMIAGLPHAAFVNAAFSYWRPRELNRFNGPGRGAWYAALAVETCIREISFHMTRELERVSDFFATVDYAEMFASFAGQFTDLRGIEPKPACLHPDPAVGYPAGNALADAARARGDNAIVYPSVRHTGGTCLAALWPAAVQSVAQGRVLRLQWKGERNPEVSEIG